MSKEKSGSRRSVARDSEKRFNLGNRLRASDPVAIAEGALRIERLKDHPGEEELRRFISQDLSLGELKVILIGAHLGECNECRAHADQK